MINKAKFLSDIATLKETTDFTYMEAVVYWCEIHKLEVEAVASIVKSDKVLKSMLKSEAQDLNYIKKSKKAKLPI